MRRHRRGGCCVDGIVGAPPNRPRRALSSFRMSCCLDRAGGGEAGIAVPNLSRQSLGLVGLYFVACSLARIYRSAAARVRVMRKCSTWRLVRAVRWAPGCASLSCKRSWCMASSRTIAKRSFNIGRPIKSLVFPSLRRRPSRRALAVHVCYWWGLRLALRVVRREAARLHVV